MWFSQPSHWPLSLPLTTGFVVNGPPAPLCLDHLGYPERFNLPPARHGIFHFSFPFKWHTSPFLCLVWPTTRDGSHQSSFQREGQIEDIVSCPMQCSSYPLCEVDEGLNLSVSLLLAPFSIILINSQWLFRVRRSRRLTTFCWGATSH